MLKSFLRYAFLTVAAAILSVTTIVFGALPMRAVRLLYGRLAYWVGFSLVSTAIAVAVAPLQGLLVFALTVLVGIYTEAEEHGGSIFTSGFVALLATVGTTALGAGAWIRQSNGRLLESVRAEIEPLVHRIAEMNGGASLDVDSVLQQIPSGIVIGFVLALAIALISERRILGLVGQRPRNKGSQSLLQFRVPDALVWLAIASIFGAFFRHGNVLAEAISLNVLNVLILVFFFQGLAIAAHLFRVYKVSPIWQGIWYVILVLQLFLLVGLIGFADFWLEFRERLARKQAETNKSF